MRWSEAARACACPMCCQMRHVRGGSTSSGKPRHVAQHFEQQVERRYAGMQLSAIARTTGLAPLTGAHPFANASSVLISFVVCAVLPCFAFACFHVAVCLFAAGKKKHAVSALVNSSAVLRAREYEKEVSLSCSIGNAKALWTPHGRSSPIIWTKEHCERTPLYWAQRAHWTAELIPPDFCYDPPSDKQHPRHLRTPNFRRDASEAIRCTMSLRPDIIA